MLNSLYGPEVFADDDGEPAREPLHGLTLFLRHHLSLFVMVIEQSGPMVNVPLRTTMRSSTP